uniref:Uncharacterized protein n=1 Tax=Arundo donax TaxID=35708 RepID=A0A0A9BA97_ARUDO
MQWSSLCYHAARPTHAEDPCCSLR